jgi:hypothetical protein
MRHLRGAGDMNSAQPSHRPYFSALERPLWRPEDVRRQTTYSTSFCKPAHGQYVRHTLSKPDLQLHVLDAKIAKIRLQARPLH